MSKEAEPATNADTRTRRGALPAENDFDIATLLRLPPYWGWVSCRPTPSTDFRMLLGGSDDGVALRFFWNGHYEKATLALWTRLARSAALAIDIGAHTGAYSLAARAANPTLHVVSFEPHFMNFARLTLNLRANGFATTDCYMIAIGDRSEPHPFTVRTDADYLTTGGALGSGLEGATTEVQLVRLDDFFPGGISSQVDLIKMDVEGHEAACFTGMEMLLDTSRPTLIFECTDEAGAVDIQASLEPLGYRFFEIDDHAGDISPVAVLRPVVDGDGRPLMNRLNRIATTRDEVVALLAR